jgi:group I intron endonuclease
MPDYQKGKIYCLRNTVNDMVYVGSTTQLLCERMRLHRSDANKEKKSNVKVYKAFKDLGVEKFYIELLEDCPCDRKEQLLKREGEYIRKFDSHKNGYNEQVAGRTIKEYYENNKEIIKEKNKEYYENNKDIIIEKCKNYREANKEIISEKSKNYREKNKGILNEKSKEYREANKDIIKEKKKIYYEENKEIINGMRKENYEANKEIICEKRKIKVECKICNCEVRKNCFQLHTRTLKHQENLKNQSLN